MPFAVVSYIEFVGIFIILGWGVYLVYRVGQLSNAPVFTMIVGAYFSAYVVRDLSWPFSLALIAATAVGALAAFLPALKLGRAPAFTVAIATIALIFIGQTVIRNLEFLGGIHGFYYIPHVGYIVPRTWAALVVVGFIIYRLDHSQLGRAMDAIFVNPDLAATQGVDIFRVRLFLHAFSGALGALAGVFYAFTIGTLQIESIGFSLLLSLFCFLFVGGSTTMWGLVVFTPILWAISVFLPEQTASWKDIIYGCLLMIILILRPNGVIDRPVLRAFRLKVLAWVGRLRGRSKIKEVTQEAS